MWKHFHFSLKLLLSEDSLSSMTTFFFWKHFYFSIICWAPLFQGHYLCETVSISITLLLMLHATKWWKYGGTVMELYVTKCNPMQPMMEIWAIMMELYATKCNRHYDWHPTAYLTLSSWRGEQIWARSRSFAGISKNSSDFFSPFIDIDNLHWWILKLHAICIIYSVYVYTYMCRFGHTRKSSYIHI